MTMLLMALPATNPPGPAGPGDALRAEAAGLRPVLRAMIARLLGQGPGHPDVEDATQEALRRVIEGLGGLRAGEPLRPWAFGVARHVALDGLRARRRAQLRAGEAVDDVLERVAADGPDPETTAATEQRLGTVQAALAQLPEGTRQALLLFHGEGLSYQQIAERLGLPLGTVATWITRGRQSLAESCQPRGRSSLLWNIWTSPCWPTPTVT